MNLVSRVTEELNISLLMTSILCYAMCHLSYTSPTFILVTNITEVKQFCSDVTLYTKSNLIVLWETHFPFKNHVVSCFITH